MMLRHGFYLSKRIMHTQKAFQMAFRNGIKVAFGKYLLLTNTVSSGLLMFMGDIAQQEIEYQQKKLNKRYDYNRLARMIVVGVGLGPLHHYFYLYLNKLLPERDIITITKKIGVDQFIMSPACIAAFFYGLGVMEGKQVEESTVELKSKFTEVYMMDWCVWPPTQFINFYLVPVKYQVLYINAVTMLYNIFLSYIKHRENALSIQHSRCI